MGDSLQKKTLSGMLWTFGQKFSIELFAFIQGIILARLLAPAEFGLVAMTQIFFAISRCFIDSGFTTALIRKNNREAIDYSTVYVTNIVVTFFFAVVLYTCAPLISHFYNESILIPIVRVNALLLFVNSFIAVQGTRMRINLQFKQLGICSVVVTIVIGLTSIALAYMGFGVWALILPNFLSPIIYAFFYWHYQHWFPGFNFSWKIWRDYFSFGSKLLASILLNTIWENLYPIIIGKKYSAKDLGFYSKASSYAYLPSKTFQGVIEQVTFPVLCSIQDDDNRLRNAYRRLIRISGYVIFPLLIGIAVLAKPFVILFLTEKWAASIPYLQVICLAAMWYPIHALNLNLLQLKGRSDLFLILEIVKKVVSLIVIIISVPYGVFYMCVGSVVSSFLCLIINTYYTGKLINVGFFTQMRDLFPSLFFSFFMGFIIWLFSQCLSSLWLQLILGIPIGVLCYFCVSYIMKSSELQDIIRMLNGYLFRKTI